MCQTGGLVVFSGKTPKNAVLVSRRPIPGLLPICQWEGPSLEAFSRLSAGRPFSPRDEALFSALGNCLISAVETPYFANYVTLAKH